MTRCLRKDPEKRFHHMVDVRVALDELKEESDSGKLAGAHESAARRRPGWRLLAVTAAALLVGASWFAWHRLNTPAAPPRVVSLTAYTGIEQYPAFSPDGRQLAFSWNGEKQDNEDIYVQLTGSGAPPLRLTSDPAPDRAPVWSPDGTQIAFVRGEGSWAAVYVTPPLGGQERKVTDLRALLPLFYVMTPTVCWSPDGRWLAVAQLGPDETHGVFLVPVESGEVRKLISNPVAEGRFYWPVLSPKGDFLAYSQCTGSRACDLYVLELGAGYAQKGEPRRLTRRGAVIEGITWTPDGRSLIYTAVPDLGSGFSMCRISVSGNAEPERLELTGDRALHPALSRDGKRLAYSRYEWDSDIWKHEAGVPPQRFISSTRNDFQPEFSPDGRRIAFATDRSGAGTELWVADRDGTNLVRLVKGWGGLLGDPDWSPDGRWITFHAQGEDADWNIYVIDAAGGQPRRLTPERTEDQRPTWSRDGRSVYFSSNRSGRYEVYRIPREGGDWTQITENGGVTTLESSDGKVLYYERRCRKPERLRPPAEAAGWRE